MLNGTSRWGVIGMLGRTSNEPKLLFPGLAGFYTAAAELWYPVVRLIAGGCLLYYGWGKFMAGVEPLTGAMTKNGFAIPSFWAFAAIFLETVGAAAIIVGLFTRFFASALAIEMAIIAFYVQMARSFPQMVTFLLWGAVMVLIALRGGGRYSVDHAIGKEL